MPAPSNVQITPPPGLLRNGTIYQAKGRWYDASLVRFQQDQVKPVGGWQQRAATNPPFPDKIRAITTWRDLSANKWIALGGSAHLYAQSESGTNHDITPAGYTVGRDDATRNLGYGGGFYGETNYGVPPPGTVAYQDATVWSLDTFGEDLVACANTDGKIYYWAPNPAAVAIQAPGSPVGCVGLITTAEGILMALGADSDGKRVAWSDQQDLSDWIPTTSNQAGDYDISAAGTLRCAVNVRGATLLLTDSGLTMATYIGAPLVYGFQRIATGCGIISPGAVAAHDSMAVWMGKNGAFWMFDGQTVQPLDCDVLGYIHDFNVNQQSKITAVHLADQGEVWWFYPSSSALENDRYVCWSYRESQRQQRNIWTIGLLVRTCGENHGVFTFPLMVDAGGILWEHETGIDRAGSIPFLESGPFEMGLGDYMAEVQRIVPDQSADMQLQAQFFLRSWPNGPETSYGPTPLVSPTDVLFQATEIRTRFYGDGDWRLGNVRLDIIQGDAADSVALVGAGPFILDTSHLDGADVLT